MSIKAFLAASLAAISVVMGIMAVLLVSNEFRSARAASDARELVDILEATTVIAESMSPERGATAVAMVSSTAPNQQSMQDARRRTDAAFVAAGRVIAASSVVERQKAAETFDKLQETLLRARTLADAASGTPQQVAETQLSFITTMNGLNSDNSELGAVIERRLFATDADVANLASVAQIAWNFRDNAGRMSTLYLQGITTGKPFSPDLLRQMDMAEGRVAQSWLRLSQVGGSTDSPPAMRQAVGKVAESFITPIKTLRERVAKHGMIDGAYDLDGAEWRRLSAPMLQSIMLIRDAAINVARSLADDKRSKAAHDLYGVLGLLAVAVVVVGGVAQGSNRWISRPLAALTGVVANLAGGGRQFSVPYRDRSDEIGRMAQAIGILRENAVAADLLASREAVEIQAKEARRQRVERIAAEFVASINGVVGAVTGSAQGVRGETRNLGQSADTATDRSMAVSGASGQATANVETVAAAAEELSSSIQEISRRVGEAAMVTDAAMRQAEATDGTVRGLSDAAHRIGEVVKLINDIATQTNLLALNATIEAARAGDAGKGFAVVAGEVKHLANQTARATEDIQAQVAAIQAETDKAVQAIGGIAQTISSVNQATVSIASAVEQQGAATQEIARNVQQAAAGTAEVSRSIVQVMGAVKDTGTVAGRLSGLADNLFAESERLQQQVGGFIAEITAA
jgi:methyl-accepting chemotaxis protein